MEKTNVSGISYTKVWKIDGQLVVAYSITEAISIYKSYMGGGSDPNSVEVVSVSDDDHLALIRNN